MIKTKALSWLNSPKTNNKKLPDFKVGEFFLLHLFLNYLILVAEFVKWASVRAALVNSVYFVFVELHFTVIAVGNIIIGVMHTVIAGKSHMLPLLIGERVYEGAASVNNVALCYLKIACIPGICHLARSFCIIKQKTDFLIGIAAANIKHSLNV